MLVVTIHDVAPPTLEAVRQLRELCRAWGAARITLLAVPNFHGLGTLAGDPPTRDWLRQCADAGDEVALHGLYHRQARPSASARDGLRARMFTAGEGELLDPSIRPEALAAARDELAALIGAPVPGFVAPAWLEPRGFGGVLARLGFGWHEVGLGIERLRDRRWFRSPVIGFATRTRWREQLSLGWARALAPAVEQLAWLERPARVALHPADLTSRRVVDAAERTIRRLARSHQAVTTAAALALG